MQTVDLEFNGAISAYVPDQSFVPNVGSVINIGMHLYLILNMRYFYEEAEYGGLKLQCISFTVERY